jgi:hypothetical protein
MVTEPIGGPLVLRHASKRSSGKAIPALRFAVEVASSANHHARNTVVADHMGPPFALAVAGHAFPIHDDLYAIRAFVVVSAGSDHFLGGRICTVVAHDRGCTVVANHGRCTVVAHDGGCTVVAHHHTTTWGRICTVVAHERGCTVVAHHGRCTVVAHDGGCTVVAHHHTTTSGRGVCLARRFNCEEGRRSGDWQYQGLAHRCVSPLLGIDAIGTASAICRGTHSNAAL